MTAATWTPEDLKRAAEKLSEHHTIDPYVVAAQLSAVIEELLDCRKRAKESYDAYMNLDDKDDMGLARAYGMLEARMHMAALDLESIVKWEVMGGNL